MALKKIVISICVTVLINSAVVEGALPFFGGKKKRQQKEPIAVQDAKAALFMERAQENIENNNLRAAHKSFKRIAKRYPHSFHAPNALYRSARLYFDRRRFRKAFEDYYRIIRGYPNFENYNQVITEEFEIASALMEEKTSKYFGIIPFRNYDLATRYFEAIIASAPYSDYAPLSLMNVALIHKKRGNSLHAIDALDRLINFYPRSMLASDAYLELAESFSSMVDGPRYDQGATREAISHYEDFLILYPEGPEVSIGETGLSDMQDVYAKSKLQMGEFYYKKRSNYVAAQVFFNEAITVAPTSPSANKAREYLAAIDEIPEESRLARGSKRSRRTTKKRGFAFWKKEPKRKVEIAQNTASSATMAGETVEAKPPETRRTEQPKNARRTIGRTLIFWKKGQAKEGPNAEE